jgi:hypothetical protein
LACLFVRNNTLIINWSIRPKKIENNCVTKILKPDLIRITDKKMDNTELASEARTYIE